MKIEDVLQEDYSELLCVWENSVGATHDFITEEDIEFLNQSLLSKHFLPSR
ncbi:MAG: hypothetical protein V2I33_07750 [Kangiellaceae bacterium]|jgi:putative acetyltransferase|nr:hypothetical protein [Kangiellaceae bacterium]